MLDSKLRTWQVKSNAFDSDYQIAGVTLEDAIKSNIGRICSDVTDDIGAGKSPAHGDVTGKNISVYAEWMPDILDGSGGAELTITTPKKKYIVWINARVAELRQPLKFNTYLI